MNASPATEFPPEDQSGRTDIMSVALAKAVSGRLVYVSPTVCRLRMSHVVSGEREWTEFDLRDYILPQTGLLPCCTLADERSLAIATVLAIDLYLMSAGHDKATHRTVVTILSSIAKLWEWGRINLLYRLEDWTSAHFRKLESQLAKGKWTIALQLTARVEAALKASPERSVIARPQPEISIRTSFLKLLETNASAQEIWPARPMIEAYVSGGVVDRSLALDEERPPTVTWLCQTYWAANLISALPKEHAFRCTPYPAPLARAKQIAAHSPRTPTLSVNHAVGLLLHSMKYVYEIGEIIIRANDLITDIAHQAKRFRSPYVRYRHVKMAWEKSTARHELEERLGATVSPFTRAKEEEFTLPQLSDHLMTAATILIAGFNARRKDEITHRKLGLNRESMLPVNVELQVYEGLFYIEKSLKSYAPYFVNQATYDAFCIMRSLEESFLRREKEGQGESLALHGQYSMFWRRGYDASTGAFQKRVWFEFTLDRSKSGASFVSHALGSKTELQGSGAHIFRRFYAILYCYRFSHLDLIGARFQLAHLSTSNTRQYVTDAMVQAVETRIPVELRRAPDDIRDAMTSEWRGIEDEIKKVGQEKLGDMLGSLLANEAASGGFPRLVMRVSRLLMKDADYAAMDEQRRLVHLQRRLQSRGHSLRPLPHADCLAGASAARGAKCAKDRRGPAPENAEPIVCATCAYSWTTAGHLAGQKLGLEQLEKEIAAMPQGSLLAQQMVSERSNLEKAIWLHEKRLKNAVANPLKVEN